MPRTYFPRAAITVVASPPHPAGTEYLVSIGDERWEGKVFAHVVKIQMVFNGRIEGRKAPSYPVGTDDFERVALAVRQISGEDAAPKSKPSHALLRGAGYYAALADLGESPT